MPIRVFCLPKKSQMYRQGFISILVLFADYVNACSGWIHEKKRRRHLQKKHSFVAHNF